MKKFLALLLAVAMLVTFAACGDKKNNTDDTLDTGFVKPQNYVTVVKLSINPEFNFYLDKDNKVLAVEALNDDALKVKEKLADTDKDFYSVVKDVISATNDAGMVKENAFVKVSITEVKDEAVNTDDILTNTENAIKEKATELKVTVTVETKVEAKEEIKENEEDKTETSSKEETTKTEPIIYRLFMTNTFNDDGSLNFDVIARETIQFFDDNKYLKSEMDGIEFNFEIPEKVIYEKAKAKFVITDKIWADFKAKGSYDLEGPEKATYKNGVFYYTRYDSWGGGEPITYSFFNFYDNKKGTIEITYQVTPAESNPYKMRVVYQYDTKYANAKYEKINPNNQYYVGAIKSENKDFINSLKISKIIESPTKNITYIYDGVSMMFYLYESNPTALVCYGFSGGTPGLNCSCNQMANLSEKKWRFNSTTNEATCPCGNTVLKNPFIDEVHW